MRFFVYHLDFSMVIVMKYQQVLLSKKVNVLTKVSYKMAVKELWIIHQKILRNILNIII